MKTVEDSNTALSIMNGITSRSTKKQDLNNTVYPADLMTLQTFHPITAKYTFF